MFDTVKFPSLFCQGQLQRHQLGAILNKFCEIKLYHNSTRIYKSKTIRKMVLNYVNDFTQTQQLEVIWHDLPEFKVYQTSPKTHKYDTAALLFVIIIYPSQFCQGQLQMHQLVEFSMDYLYLMFIVLAPESVLVSHRFQLKGFNKVEATSFFRLNVSLANIRQQL